MSGLGWQKNGMENRGLLHSERGGFTTRCVVDFNRWFVNRWSMSPTLTTMCSGKAVMGIHTLSCLSTSNPEADAPTSKVIKLMSSCCPARTAESGSEVMGG